MKLLPKDKDKRNKLILTVVIIGTLLSLYGYSIIRPQRQFLATAPQNLATEQAKLEKIKQAIKRSDITTNDLVNITAQLQDAEGDIASGDIYAWTYDTIRHFKNSYDVNIPAIGQPAISDVDLLAQFPYKQLKISLNGSAYYHDFGKFIADLENTFPHMRVVDITLEPSLEPVSDSSQGQQLNFRADVIALVKPN